MEARAPFDPSNPFDVCADRLRQGIAFLVLDVFASPDFQGLPPEQRLACMMAGLLTASMGAMLSLTPEDFRNDPEFIRIIANYLPEAKLNAEDIMANAPEGGLQ